MYFARHGLFLNFPGIFNACQVCIFMTRVYFTCIYVRACVCVAFIKMKWIKLTSRIYVYAIKYK